MVLRCPKSWDIRKCIGSAAGGCAMHLQCRMKIPPASFITSQGEAYAHFVCEEMEPGLLSNAAYNSFMDLLEAAFKTTKEWRVYGAPTLPAMSRPGARPGCDSFSPHSPCPDVFPLHATLNKQHALPRCLAVIYLKWSKTAEQLRPLSRTRRVNPALKAGSQSLSARLSRSCKPVLLSTRRTS